MTPPRGPRGAEPGRAAPGPAPTLREERRLLREGALLVAGMDEVGRGALAGPVSVGVVVVGPGTRTAPAGVRDSKLLTPAAREALVPRLRRWAVGAVGHAEPAEIDAVGIIAALRLAGHRAMARLDVRPDVIILDGSHDWFTEPGTAPPRPAAPDQEGLFAAELVVDPRPPAPRVRTMVKADLRCAAVAAASVLAKVERDALMVAMAEQHPAYGWAGNKGYAAPDHVAALREHGPCRLHRRSWSLPGVTAGGGATLIDLADELTEQLSGEVSDQLSDALTDQLTELGAPA